MTDTPKCPPLSGSGIDFDTLNAALAAGEDPEAAMKKAQTKPNIAERTAKAKAEAKKAAEKPASKPKAEHNAAKP